MYETGYEDIKEMIKKLISMCQNNPELTEKMIQIYHIIRILDKNLIVNN